MSRYSRPARDDLDRKLAAYLPASGFFVEAGAHDGYSDSNTYYLERMKGWRGVLVEPVPGNYRSCVLLRRRSKVIHAALVDAAYPHPSVSVHWGDRMSWVDGAFSPEENQQRELAVRKWVQPQTFDVPARTLASILDEVKLPRIDFLSLDVEGYEPAAIRGLDLSRHRPTWALIECRTQAMRDEVGGLLAGYREVARLSHHDYLFHSEG